MNTTIAPRTPKQERSAQFSMGFSCIGHTYAHLFTPIFFTLVPLALEDEFGLSHGETVALIFFGNLLFGLAAPLAGWLADRWTATGMMAIFYVGTGAAMIMCGMVESPLALGFWLGMTGLFASIYHPVGIAWLVRESVNTGTVLGVNGIFGSLGTAAAAVMAGWLVHLYGWRSAYILPGIVVIVTGLVFTGLLIKGVIIESKTDRKPPPPPSTPPWAPGKAPKSPPSPPPPMLPPPSMPPFPPGKGPRPPPPRPPP
ncbi:MAG: MFS transporter, partial [Rhodospirillales bacterium]|nr:MFS transporter [Rhodospirillales bacterium]